MVKAFILYCTVIFAGFAFAQHQGYAAESLFGHHFHGNQQSHGGFYAGSSGYHK
ncbi:MAG: hypothetical protein WCD70_08820 [Alphaproteobacteria bacterium]